MNKADYERWLRKKGLHPEQIKVKKKALGSPVTIPSYVVESTAPLSNTVGNGTKSPDMSKANFSKSNYAMAPAYNKGPVMVVSKEDLKLGVGRKNQ